MSTILKALKQAEKDCSDQETENRPSFNVRTAFSSRMQQQKRSTFLSLGRIVIPVALVIVMAIFSYPLFFTNKKTQPQTPFTGKQPQVLDTQPAIAKDQKQRVAEPVTESFGLPEAPIKILPKSAIEPFDLPDPLNERVLKPEPVNQVPVGEASSNKAKEKIHDKPPEQIILPLKNDSLRVQAISWDQKHANRIAVIDNSVLREGDFVQGYRLVSIEKDSVILYYSGSNYRLGFKYR